MDEFLGAVKQRRDDLFLKLVKKITKPDYKMHFMEDRNGRRAMFYNYKGVEIKENDCVLLKATIAEHRRDRYKNVPLTYLNRVVVRKNMGTKENPKIVFGEEGIERGSSNKTWQEQISEEDVA
jgi:ribosomal protein S28E/S33